MVLAAQANIGLAKANLQAAAAKLRLDEITLGYTVLRALITVFGTLWFHIPFVGSPFVPAFVTALFLIVAIGFGLLLSTLSRTQQQAFALNFFLVNPLLILSGFAFPIAAMPRILQWITWVNPLRYFLVVIRAVFLKGVGVEVLCRSSPPWPCSVPGCSR
jgi:ABC-type multidrug transport system permease subunit